METDANVHHTTKRRKLDLNNGSDTESELEEAPASPSKLDHQRVAQDGSETESEAEGSAEILLSSRLIPSLERVITPPDTGKASADTIASSSTNDHSASSTEDSVSSELKILPSPFQLTHVRDLPSTSNMDTVSLSDILGDPLIKECWQFNYLFDVDFIMDHLDQDVRSIVQVKIIHGSWKKEDGHRLALEEAAKRYENVQLITAYMPEPFGTHHSKMMILIRHDDLAQIVIHTANMIPQDWKNMCQAVWRSPLLPSCLNGVDTSHSRPIGSGGRFKFDLLGYLKMYGKRLGNLPDRLAKHDFGSVRAAFIASAPCRLDPKPSDSSKTAMGWPGLLQILRQIPSRTSPGITPRINIQVSSVATLGRTDEWLQNLFNLLSNSKPCLSSKDELSDAVSHKQSQRRKPNYRVIFPTADTIRRSLDGYASGGSVHWKLQSPVQQAQLAYFKPYLSHWASDSASIPQATMESTPQSTASPGKDDVSRSIISGSGEAERRRAGPHIKSYIRFSDSSQSKIDWAMLTSANLSTQAWGSLPGKKEGTVRISSWETGVVIWPELVGEERGTHRERPNAVMVPTFGHDKPSNEQVEAIKDARGVDVVIGLRMPYDLPLLPYAADDEPWCATAEYDEPDWKGIAWV